MKKEAFKIGQRVTYTCHGLKEHGEVTSFNDTYIFVRYDGQIHSKGCRPYMLEPERKGLPNFIQSIINFFTRGNKN